LLGYQAMPSEELLYMRAVALTISVAELISQPGLRVTCARCGEAVINGREVRVDGRILCRGCADGAYYRSVERETTRLSGRRPCEPSGARAVGMITGRVLTGGMLIQHPTCYSIA
jgi:hypothetical protein